MAQDEAIGRSIQHGWQAYQEVMVRALKSLRPNDLAFRAGKRSRSVGEIAAHIVAVRARWFNRVMGEGGDGFQRIGEWDRPGAESRDAAELVQGLEATWLGMQKAITSWTPEEWARTWPGDGDTEPEVMTRQWILWHLIEHDIHHGGQLSILLRANGAAGFEM